MVGLHWRTFHDEVARWRDLGRQVDFWWRDDDACRPDPALSRLCALSGAFGVPLALAVIPAAVEAAAFEDMPASVTVIQHGADHCNRAPAGQKKSEFPGNVPLDAALQRLAEGRARLRSAAGDRVLDVLAPPWNRIHAPLVAQLAKAGYLGLSTYRAREAAMPVEGLVQVNTHVDIIDWKGTRGFVGAESALGQATRHLVSRRTGTADASEPTGWLTHHAVHDEGAWTFLSELFEATRDLAGIRWRYSRELFAPAKRGHDFL
jgi:hypothetical protein